MSIPLQVINDTIYCHLFSGNAMNRFLNENWQKLAEELQTPMEDALRDFLKPLADHAFATLNAEDILSS